MPRRFTNAGYYSVFASAAMILSIAVILVSGCELGSVREQTIDAKLDVPVKDPNLKLLTRITSRGHIEASGSFKQGTFLVNNVPLTIPKDTRFKLDLTLPVDDPATLSTRNAVGTFDTTRQLSIAGVPLPESIRLEKGHVHSKLDLARTLAAFFLNVVQVGGSYGGVNDMIDSLELDLVELKLRPDSVLDIGNKSLHIGPKSRILLRDAVVNNKLHYKGQCLLSLNFLKGCRWIGEKVDCLFDGGDLDLIVDAQKLNDRIVLTASKTEEKITPITLLNCTFRFGKNKRSSSTSDTTRIDPTELKWKSLESASKPEMHLLADMSMTGTNLRLKTDAQETKAFFSENVNGYLEIDTGEGKGSTRFSTRGSAHAQSGTIVFKGEKTNLTLRLTDVTVGSLRYDKSGALGFRLKNGRAKVKEFDWQSKGTTLALVCGKGSVLEVPDEMMLEKPAGERVKTHLELPVELNLGSATLSNKTRKIELANLHGKAVIHTGTDIHVTSALDFDLNNSTIFGGHAIGIDARGLDLSVKDGRAGFQIKRCSVVVPEEALHKSIAKRIPADFSLQLNKTLKAEKKWRYRNTIAKSAQVSRFKLARMTCSEPGVLSFSASADVVVDGTVEKSGVILHKKDWQTKPWTISGHVTGNGSASYKIKQPAKSPGVIVNYDMTATVPVPDDVKLDWSEVAGGLLKLAERRVIVKHLKQIKVPLEHKGSLSLFDKSDALSKYRISNVSINDVKDGKKIQFKLSSVM